MTSASLVARTLRFALAEVVVPPILPGDPIAAGVREMLFEGADVSLRRGGMFYGMDGEPIEDLPTCSAMRQVEALRHNEGGEISDTVSTGGVRSVRIGINTAFLGVDLSTFGPLPLVWETLIFVGDGPLHILEPYRYATRAAAHSGHAQVLAVVREGVGS